MISRTRRSVIAGAALAPAAVLSLSSSVLAQAAADNGDIVKAELEKAAAQAAAARASSLLRDPGSPVLGNPQGDVTLVKFTDYQCSYCKAADPRIEKLIADDPKVRVVVKEFPILGPVSVVAAKAALAAQKQGKYAAYHQVMMGYRGKLTEADIFAMAGKVGLNVEKLKVDMESPEVTGQIIATFDLARALKISLTPGYIVNATVLSGVSAKTSSSAINFPQEIAAARSKS
ncbi:MAG: DsbA family protein [Rhodospirillaceae bacterium]